MTSMNDRKKALNVRMKHGVSGFAGERKAS